MTDSELPAVMIWLYVAVGLLAVLVALAVGIWRRLGRLEKRMGEGEGQPDAAVALAEATVGGAFESFLNEDPGRRMLAKGEQFAAYRRWRQERGMNWSKP